MILCSSVVLNTQFCVSTKAVDTDLLNSDTDPDPGFDDQKLKKKYS